MDKFNIERSVEELAEPIAEQFGCQLVGAELIEEEGEWYLRVYIDKDGGVSMEDCVNVTRPLNEKVDDVLPEGLVDYFEVSSPGPDRLIKKDEDFERFKDSQVHMMLNSKVRDMTEFEGKLVGLENDNIIINVKGQMISIERQKVLSVKLSEK
jgi:ribosome maturation factor RimP